MITHFQACCSTCVIVKNHKEQESTCPALQGVRKIINAQVSDPQMLHRELLSSFCVVVCSVMHPQGRGTSPQQRHNYEKARYVAWFPQFSTCHPPPEGDNSGGKKWLGRLGNSRPGDDRLERGTAAEPEGSVLKGL